MICTEDIRRLVGFLDSKGANARPSLAVAQRRDVRVQATTLHRMTGSFAIADIADQCTRVDH